MIELIAITSLALYATGVLQQEGMLLYPIRQWLDKRNLPYLIAKPLYLCPPCMASIWGSLVWFFVPGQVFCIGWPLFCLAVCGFTYLLIHNFPFDD